MCILAGCDYVPSIDGIGIKTAYKLLNAHGDAERVFLILYLLSEAPQNYLLQVIRHLRQKMGSKVPPTYEEDFKKVHKVEKQLVAAHYFFRLS